MTYTYNNSLIFITFGWVDRRYFCLSIMILIIIIIIMMMITRCRPYGT